VHGLALALAHGIRRVLASLGALVVVFAVGWVPVIGTIAAVVATAWFTAHSAAYDCYDAVLARRLMAYRDKLAYLARFRRRTTGLGGAVAVLLFVPGLNLIALGLGAAGATVAALELERRIPVQPGARIRIPVAGG
jgi:CysZ protein